MNQIHHHPDDGTLLAYAAGAVSEAIGLVLAAHFDRCRSCFEKIAEAESVGGALLDSLTDTELPRGGLAAVWDTIDSKSAAECAAQTRMGSRPSYAVPSEVPRPLAPYFPEGFANVRWQPVAPGIRRRRLSDVASGRGTVQLLWIAPGMTLPRHTHRGTELTLVLSGSYTDELGRFCSGDIADLDPSISHQPAADDGAPCICLIATDERLQFTGLASRLLQPLVRI